MHNLRKLKKKKKAALLNQEESAQEKLIEISRYQIQEEPMSDVDVFVEKLQPKNINPEVKKQPRGRIFDEQQKMTQFISQFQRHSKLNSSHIPLQQLRSSTYSFTQKKPIALVNYLLIDNRSKGEKIDEKPNARSKFQSLVNLKRKCSPRNKFKFEDDQDRSLDHVRLNVLSRKEQIARLFRDNAEGTKMKMKKMKFFTKYNSVFVGR